MAPDTQTTRGNRDEVMCSLSSSKKQTCCRTTAPLALIGLLAPGREFMWTSPGHSKGRCFSSLSMDTRSGPK